uniref:Uncharacterized protein n=1 Tax=Caenorhabditis japonica TaxID=281687 RepID=A0A8R1EC20_CAEJA
MQKFVVIELNDEESCIDLLSYCVKRNLERVSLLTRLEDHPYIREMNDREINPDVEIQDPESVLVQLNDEERQRLLNIINSPGAQTLALERIHHPSQDQHLLQQHQIPSTSAYNEK